MPPNLEDIPVETFVLSAMQAGKKRGISMIVYYAFQRDGKALLKMSSLEPPAKVAALLQQINQVPGNVGAGAEAIHNQEFCVICREEKAGRDSWASLDDTTRAVHVQLAEVVVNASRVG